MPMTTAAAAELVELLFNNGAWANVGDGAGLQPSGSAGVFYVSLHTAAPGLGGNQSSNETTYGSYARVAVVRTSSGWALASNVASPVGIIQFPVCTSGTATITHAGLGTASSGAGTLIGYGTVSPNLSVAVGLRPELTTASTITAT